MLESKHAHDRPAALLEPYNVASRLRDPSPNPFRSPRPGPQVVEAFKILQGDKQVQAILVNIFGEPGLGQGQGQGHKLVRAGGVDRSTGACRVLGAVEQLASDDAPNLLVKV